MVYREQAYLEEIERCACNAPSTGPCKSCRRPWCDAHREGSMCIRCSHAIAYEVGQRVNQRVAAALSAWGVVAVGFSVVHMAIGIFLGIPLAVAVYFAVLPVQRRLWIARMAPRLASTTGEIVPPRPPPPIANSHGSDVSYGNFP
jgi:hypothetical protein